MVFRSGVLVALLLLALGLSGCTAPCLPLLSDDVLPKDAQLTLDDAESTLRAGDAARALVLFRQIVEHHPNHYRALRGEQESMILLGRDAEANELAAARERAEHDATASLLIARVAPDEATADRAVDEALLRDPKNAHARLALGVRFARDGDYAKAEAAFDEALRGCSPPAEAALARARVRALEGRFREAAADYRTYIERAPRDLFVMHELASLYHRELADTVAAEAIYNRMLGVDPKSPEAIVGIAVIATARRDYEGAERLYLSVCEIEPVALVNLGLLYRDRLGRPEDALRCFESFLAFNGPRAGNRAIGDQLFVVPGYVEELKAQIVAAKSAAAGTASVSK